jgi:hypothetical protein
MRKLVVLFCLLSALALCAAGANLTAGLKLGEAELKSAGVLALVRKALSLSVTRSAPPFYALDADGHAGGQSASAVEIRGTTRGSRLRSAQRPARS